MTTTVGASTSYQLTVPELSETADIQVALKLLSYGTSSDPANNAAISANSLAGYIIANTTSIAGKSPIASPTFTGTVTLPTGTSSVAPLKFSLGTLLTTPIAGTMEYSNTAPTLHYTNSTNTGRGIVPVSYYYTYSSNSAYLGGITAPYGFKTITLDSYTTYEVEGMYIFTFNESACPNITSSYPRFLISGTATVSSKFDLTWWCQTSGSLTAVNTARTILETYATGGTATALEGTTATTTGRSGVVKWKGIFRNSQASAGTFYATILASTPAANVSIKEGSYIKITPIGTDTVTSVGAWT